MVLQRSSLRDTRLRERYVTSRVSRLACLPTARVDQPATSGSLRCAADDTHLYPIRDIHARIRPVRMIEEVGRRHSQRMRMRSDIEKYLPRPASNTLTPGPFRTPLAARPKKPGGGASKAAGSNQWF